jgi:hypothetical protein
MILIWRNSCVLAIKVAGVPIASINKFGLIQTKKVSERESIVSAMNANLADSMPSSLLN